jgi:hypothetical protein
MGRLRKLKRSCCITAQHIKEAAMASDPRKRQKKLERRAARRKEKKHLIAREQTAGLGERLTAATAAPVLHSWVSEALWTEGLGQVLLSRQLANGYVAVAVFLVDRYCLGVKDAFAEILSRFQYDSKFVREMRGRYPVKDVTPAAVRKLVERAVAYAQDLGLPPHADYHKAKLLFGDIDASTCTEEFEFGKDGKPFFISGPYDTPERSQQILNTLARTRGSEQFDYLSRIGGSEMSGPTGFGEEQEASEEGFTVEEDREI